MLTQVEYIWICGTERKRLDKWKKKKEFEDYLDYNSNTERSECQKKKYQNYQQYSFGLESNRMIYSDRY